MKLYRACPVYAGKYLYQSSDFGFWYERKQLVYLLEEHSKVYNADFRLFETEIAGKSILTLNKCMSLPAKNNVYFKKIKEGIFKHYSYVIEYALKQGIYTEKELESICLLSDFYDLMEDIEHKMFHMSSFKYLDSNSSVAREKATVLFHRLKKKGLLKENCFQFYDNFTNRITYMFFGKPKTTRFVKLVKNNDAKIIYYSHF